MPTYRRSEVCWFHKKVNRHWVFSNMAGQMPIYWPIAQVPENKWYSSEQLYQASKYRRGIFVSPKNGGRLSMASVRSRIRAMHAPRGAKMTQKCAEKAGEIRPDWDGEDGLKLKAMHWVLELKLYWNPDTFGEELVKTGNKPIVEVSTKDDFWGCKPVGTELVGENR